MIEAKIIHKGGWEFFLAEYNGVQYPIVDWRELSIAKDFLYCLPTNDYYTPWFPKEVINRGSLRKMDKEAKKGTHAPMWIFWAKYKEDMLVNGEIEDDLFYELTKCQKCDTWFRVKVRYCPCCKKLNPRVKHIKSKTY